MTRDLSTTIQWALKSGYPFENDVHSTIKKALGSDTGINIEIRNTLEFNSRNEDGEPCIRSLDFECIINKPSWNIPHDRMAPGPSERIEISLLIDAKYTMDEAFLFVPTASSAMRYQWPHLIPTYSDLGHTLSPVATYRKDLVSFANIEGMPIASTGRKVKEQSRERDSVASAAIQVVHGLTKLFTGPASLIGHAIDLHYYRNVHYFIPIVVTSAPLLMLNNDVDVAKVRGAKSETDILQAFDLVCLELPSIYDLKTAWSQAQGTLKKTNKDLGWVDSGMGQGVILFATLSGLHSFLSDLIDKFKALPYSVPPRF